MYDDEDDEGHAHPARRARGIDFLLLPLVLVHNVVSTISDWLTDAVMLVTGHANWKRQQESPVQVTR